MHASVAAQLSRCITLTGTVTSYTKFEGQCQSGVSGRYVYVYRAETSRMDVREIQIYSRMLHKGIQIYSRMLQGDPDIFTYVTRRCRYIHTCNTYSCVWQIVHMHSKFCSAFIVKVPLSSEGKIEGLCLLADMWLTVCLSLIAYPRYQGSWGQHGADRVQMGPMLAPWTLLSENINL